MFEHILQAVYGGAWAIQPEKMSAIVEVIESRMLGIKAEGFGAAAPRPRVTKRGSVAVLAVHGIISQRMNMMNDISGGVSTQILGDDIQALAADDSVKAIVLDIDSGGGNVYGIEELVSIINEAKESKHITAVSNSLAASAAYWIGSACSEFVCTPSGEVGSIGVITAHHDQSGFDEKLGQKVTYITAGKYKAEGNPHQPLDDDAVVAIQSQVNAYYETFVNSVAKGRGVSAAEVKTGFGEGRTLGAKAALAEGMVDRIATLDDVLAKLGTKRNTTRAAKVRMI